MLIEEDLLVAKPTMWDTIGAKALMLPVSVPKALMAGKKDS